MKLEPDSLLRMRRALLERGRPSLLPPAGQPISSGPPPLSDEARAAAERVAPICELLYLMMCADGSDNRAERELLRGAVRALTDGQLRSATIDAMLARFDEARTHEGQRARLSHVANLLAADRADAEAAYSLAAALALADGGADARELVLLEELGELLGLSRERRAQLVDAD